MRLQRLLGTFAILTIALRASANPPVPLTGVAQAPRQIAGPAAAPDSVAITIAVPINLGKLNPLARTGSLKCGARAGSFAILQGAEFNQAPWEGEAAVSHYDAALGSTPHYYGAEATVSFPLANGGYSGTQTVHITIPRAALIDPQTKALFDHPAVLVGCWLYIDDRRVHMVDLGSPPLLASADNVNMVLPYWPKLPWFLVDAPIENQL